MHVTDLGYLIRPSRDRKLDLQPDVFTYEEVASRSFLTLMGETGSGKTDTIVEIGRSLRAAGHEVRYVALDLVDTGEALKRELEPSKVLARDGKEVTLLFDQYEVSGLGEATYKYLAREIAEYPPGKVKVRLGCRSGSWTKEMEREFLKDWPEMLVLELGLLTHDDVVLALSSVRADPSALLRDLEQRELVPLLTRPVTLRMIMRMVERGDDLSTLTMSEVYRKGIEELVRPVAGPPHALEGIERLAIARRLAAVSVFCHRHEVSELPDDGTAPAGTMYVSDVARGAEGTRDDDTIRVSETAVQEVVRHSGLLNSRGTGRHGWIHASYAEYLAAEYVRTHRMPVEQVRGLLRLRDDGSPIIPELQGVVSWLLVNKALPLGDEFISKWPTTVLRSDVQSLTAAQRRTLADALLEDADRGVLDTFSAIVRLRLGKLSHPDLAAQIRSWFLDRGKSVRARGLAMRIAASCKLNDLATVIAGVALDQTEPQHIRETAAYITASMGDEAAHQALRPLVDPGDDADADDQLRGAAFEALWPKHLSSADLFRLLADPRNDRFLGSYASFLRHLPEQLGVEELEPALAWANDQRSRDDIGRVRGVVDAILFRAFAHLDRPVVLQRVGDIIIARASAHVPLFEVDGGQSAPLDAPSRRLLIEHLSGRMTAEELSKTVLWARPSLLEPQDVPWLISKHQEHESGPWAHLLGDLVLLHREAMGDHLAALRDAADQSKAVNDALLWFLGPIPLDSPEATRARKDHEERQRWTARDASDRDAPVRQAILEAVLSGKTIEFIGLAFALSEKSDRNDLGLDLVKLPGWQRLSPEQQQKIHTVAHEYLRTQDENRARWLGTNSYPYLAWAGYQALRLLRHDAGKLESLSGEVWARWVGIAIGMPFENETEQEAQQDFVTHAGRVAKEALYDALRTLIASDDVNGHRHVLSLFPAPWDDEMIRLMEGAVRSGAAKGQVALLETLLAGAPERGEELAWTLIREPEATEDTRRQVYALLYRSGTAAIREQVRREVFGSPNDTGRGVIRLLAQTLEFRSPDLNQRVADSELADLYTWVEREFPMPEGEDDDSSERGVGRLRNDLLVNLGRRSTPETIAALQTLVGAFPQHAFLRRMHHEAAERVATLMWNPPTISELLALVRDRAKRFVESAEDLQTAIVESLRRLGTDLTESETPMVEFLWNDCAGCTPRFRPKDENALSNLVKRHLELDLARRDIVVNREVEIRRAAGGIGKRTDIYVRAIRRDLPLEEARLLTVIIETKRCSNPELMPSLKRQLVDDYLKPLGLRHGIYLVGWYDNDLHRCCGQKTLDQMRAELEALAKAEEPDYSLTSVVLDTGLPASMIPKGLTQVSKDP